MLKAAIQKIYTDLQSELKDIADRRSLLLHLYRTKLEEAKIHELEDSLK